MVPIILLFTLVLVKAADFPQTSHWTGSAFLDPTNSVHLQWRLHADYVTFQVTAATMGYVAIGFSTVGGMRGADVMVTWVDDEGKPHAQDRFSETYVEPVIDDHQDLEVINGTQNGTHTQVLFMRKLKTCDVQDWIIEPEQPTRVLYAIHDQDPMSNGRYINKHTLRGAKSLLLQGGEGIGPKPEETEPVVYWDMITPPGDILSDQQTLYWCSMHKAPDLQQKHQIVGWRHMVDNGSEPHVHHMTILACRTEDGSEFEPLLNKPGFNCFSKDVPQAMGQCASAIFTWAIGNEEQMMDPQVGYPIGNGDMGATYFMLEVHYDNHKFLEGRQGDRSGMKLILSPILRRYEGWAVEVGHEFINHVIPPRQKSFHSVGHCGSDCTAKCLPPEGITITHAFLHTHLTGRSISIRHIRDGIELPPLIEDQYYDFNIQLTRKLKKPVKVLPSDHLILTCDCDTMDRTNVTWGGISTLHEMCLANLYYYPRVPFTTCFSHPYMGDMARFFNFTPVWRPRNTLGQTVPYESTIEKFDFDNNIDAVQELMERGRFQQFCIKTSKSEKPDYDPHDYPQIHVPYKRKKQNAC